MYLYKELDQNPSSQLIASAERLSAALASAMSAMGSTIDGRRTTADDSFDLRGLRRRPAFADRPRWLVAERPRWLEELYIDAMRIISSLCE